MGRCAIGLKKKPKILLVDDNPLVVRQWAEFFQAQCPDCEVITCTDPLDTLRYLSEEIAFFMLDLEMPNINGKALLKIAREKGIDPRKIIIFSSTPAEDLHRIFPHGSCLAVINKSDPEQCSVLKKIIKSLIRRLSC